MGLLKIAKDSVTGTLNQQMKEFIYCESLPADVLAVKGKKKTNGGMFGSKTSSDNIIVSGSIVAVNEGQCMIIVDQGKVAEVCAEAGEFVYDASTEPSIFSGSLGEGVKNVFKTMGKRFTFGGVAPKDQRVYYINTKEIIGNRYGTPNPVPFRVVDEKAGIDIDISIKCFGEYSYQITNPILFYTNVCGNVTTEYDRSEIDSQLKSELMTALQPAFAKISDMGIRYSALPGHTIEVANALNDVLSQRWAELRGIEIVSLGINSVKASEEDEKMLKDLQRSAAFRDPSLAAAQLVNAQAQAMQAAASNTGGAGMAFMGMNMAQQAGGFNAQSLFQMGAQQQAQAAAQQQAQPAGWTCSCGAVNTGKFCIECGQPMPKPVQAGSWTCSCGAVNTGKFCMECGAKAPVKMRIKCDKCGWEPEGDKIPKFCPECGDPINEADQI